MLGVQLALARCCSLQRLGNPAPGRSSRRSPLAHISRTLTHLVSQTHSYIAISSVSELHHRSSTLLPLELLSKNASTTSVWQVPAAEVGAMCASALVRLHHTPPARSHWEKKFDNSTTTTPIHVVFGQKMNSPTWGSNPQP